jgi:hypothetical protein
MQTDRVAASTVGLQLMTGGAAVHTNNDITSADVTLAIGVSNATFPTYAWNNTNDSGTAGDSGSNHLILTNSTTVYIAGPPTAGNNVTIAAGSNYALWVDAGESRFDGSVGIGGGTISDYNANADDLLIYRTGHSGMTIYSGANSMGNIYFADSGSDYAGYIQYGHGSQGDKMIFGVGGNTDMILDSNDLSLENSSLTNVGASGNDWDATGLQAHGSNIIFTATAATGTNVHYVGGNASQLVVADDEAFTFSMGNGGLFTVTDASVRYAGVFAFSYASSTIVEISDPDSKFVITDSDTGSKIAVFTSSNSHTVTVKNYTGGDTTVRVYAHGDVYAATAIS